MSKLFRKSRVLETMRAGTKALWYKSNLTCPRVAEIVGLSGFDAIWICQEHIATDHSAMENFIRAGKMHDLDTIVRVAKGSYSDYIRPLEADAAGIMIPHLMSLDEAEYINTLMIATATMKISISGRPVRPMERSRR